MKVTMPQRQCALLAHASPSVAMHCLVLHSVVLQGVCKGLVRQSIYYELGCCCCAAVCAVLRSHAGPSCLAGAHPVLCTLAVSIL